MISLDCETTGLDLRHGAKPFMVQICYDSGRQIWWEWEVDPLTRQPRVPEADLRDIARRLRRCKSVVLQNPKFDVAALQTLYRGSLEWDWSKTYDTLLAGHLVCSNEPHDLTSMALIHLGVNVKPFEDAIQQAANEARRLVRRDYPDWRIAKAGLPEMPSAKGKVWKGDMWLPAAVAREESRPEDDPWWTVCSEYGNSDTETTLALFLRQREILKEKNLWKIYKERLKILPIVYQMESTGVTLSGERLRELQEEYGAESKRAAKTCLRIAKKKGYSLDLPKGSNNKSLTTFIFGEEGLSLEPFKKSKKTGAPSLDEECVEHYLSTLPEKGMRGKFIQALADKRKKGTSLSYMESYERFWLPLTPMSKLAQKYQQVDWYRLHPSLNPTGTHTLRWTSQNPNSQQVSRKEDSNLRYCFGPAPGREWWAIDAKNIELRIPAYEAGETEQIALFEKPDEAPFFGSNHLLVCSILHPEKFEECVRDGVSFKDRYKTLYGRTKNGNFAVQYGAMEKYGTADRAYGVKGGHKKVQSRFREVKRLNDKMIRMAQECGYVETMPDRTVDPDRGYPLYCTRDFYGGIKPTIPLNYHVQGTAMWWMMKAMIRCQEYLDNFNENRVLKARAYMIMQVHDEIVFDFPKSKLDPTIEYKGFNRLRCNLPEIKKLAKLMERGGDDIGVPTPVSVEYHPDNWGEGVSL